MSRDKRARGLPPAFVASAAVALMVQAALMVQLAAAAQLSATARPSASAATHTGKPLYERWCAECHAPGPGHPGTQQLDRTRGAKLAVLTERRDLSVEYLRYVVRNGQNAMPAYRQTEISDTELQQISQYLTSRRKLPR
jgi:(+)-pinoresinol hydroxylase